LRDQIIAAELVSAAKHAPFTRFALKTTGSARYVKFRKLELLIINMLSIMFVLDPVVLVEHFADT